MSDDKKKSFFETLPGLFTGIAAFIGACTTLYITCNKTPVDNKTTITQKADTVINRQPIVSTDTTKAKISSVANVSDAQDEFKIVSITPSLNTVLQGNGPFEINMKIHYDLESSDSAIFVAYLEQFANNDQCATGQHHTIASNNPSQVTVKKGEGDLYVKLLYEPGNGSKTDGINGTHVSPNASLWAGFDNSGKVIILQNYLWDFKDYCYNFQP